MSHFIKIFKSILTPEEWLVLAWKQLKGKGMQAWCTVIGNLLEHSEI